MLIQYVNAYLRLVLFFQTCLLKLTLIWVKRRLIHKNNGNIYKLIANSTNKTSKSIDANKTGTIRDFVTYAYSVYELLS